MSVLRRFGICAIVAFGGISAFLLVGCASQKDTTVDAAPPPGPNAKPEAPNPNKPMPPGNAGAASVGQAAPMAAPPAGGN